MARTSRKKCKLLVDIDEQNISVPAAVMVTLNAMIRMMNAYIDVAAIVVL